MPATVEEIRDAYNDYADYEEVGSVERCQLFITAAKRMLAEPSAMADQGSSMAYTTADVRNELNYAREWLRINARRASGGSSFSAMVPSRRGFR